MSKRLQKRSIDDNLRRLVLIRQDRVLANLSTCFFTSDSEFFFFTFPKKWVGRAMGNETIWGMTLVWRKCKICLKPIDRLTGRLERVNLISNILVRQD